MKRMTLFACVISSLALCAAPLVQVTQSKVDGIYAKGEQITITAQVMDEGKPVSGHTVTYTLEQDGAQTIRGKFVSDAGKPFTWSTAMNANGALRTEFVLLDAQGKKIPLPPKEANDQYRFVSGLMGATVAPEEMKLPFEKPADYESFWNQQKERLGKEPMQVLEKVQGDTIYGVTVYDVKISCPGGKVVSGYLGIPRNAKEKSHPALVFYQGAGVTGAARHQVINYGREGYIALCINALGILNGQKPEYYRELAQGEFKEYYYKMYPSKEEHFFVGLALRVWRSLEFIKSLPEWNGKDLVVMGSSQGGWQALCAASQDKAVTFCFAGVPAFSDYYGPFCSTPRRMAYTNNLGMTFRKNNLSEAAIKEYLLKVAAYFDPAFFAEKVQCKTVVTVGYCDLSCPPTTVYGIYNAIPAADKRIVHFPSFTHAGAGRVPADVDRFIKDIPKNTK